MASTRYCHGDYVNLDFNSSLCITTMQTVTECLLQINLAQILESKCAVSSNRRRAIESDSRVEEAKLIEYLLAVTNLSPLSKVPQLHCRVLVICSPVSGQMMLVSLKLFMFDRRQ
ncbi:hypothetical protein Ancab_017587 [Ancistrocladus abbreviatus]